MKNKCQLCGREIEHNIFLNDYCIEKGDASRLLICKYCLYAKAEEFVIKMKEGSFNNDLKNRQKSIIL